jgi:hypothetical protein
MLGAAVGVGGVGGVVTPLLVDSRRHSPRHHDGILGVAVVAVCVLVAMLAALLVLRRKLSRNQGMFAAPLIVGLRWKDRRAVTRAVRRGRPSSDPTLAAVEMALAQRTVSQARRTMVVFVVAMAGEGILAVLNEHAAARIFYGSGVLLFAGLLVTHQGVLRGARRYLAHAPVTARGNIPP